MTMSVRGGENQCSNLSDDHSGQLVPAESPTSDQGDRQIATESQNQQDGQQQQQRSSGWSMFKTLAIRMLFIYLVSSWFRSGQKPQKETHPTARTASGDVVHTNGPAINIFARGTSLDLYIYLSEEKNFINFNDKRALFWLEEDIVYGDWSQGDKSDGIFIKHGQIKASQAVMNNESIYLHIYLVQNGQSPNPRDTERYKKSQTVYKTQMLNKYKTRKYHTMSNLLTGKTEAHKDLVRKANETVAVEILSHWHPNLTVNLVEDQTPWTPGSVPQPLDQYVKFVSTSHQYQPIVYVNDYWNLNSDYMPINSSTPVLNLTLTFSQMSLFKWQMYAAQGMRNKWYSSMFGDDFMTESDDDQDSLKKTLVETNPYLLALTIIISLVHSVFEFLAFKNDIQFWKNRKSLEGLSVRSVFFNVFQSLVVVLYVLDNETNTVVRISVFIGLLIEIWKIQKVVDIKVDLVNRIGGLLPRLWFEDKSTYTKSDTKKYDQMAFKYLGMALFPLMGCYAVYSVLYQEHKGWYSWVLSLLYGFLLTFGFIMMTPQLFINYKLKSVAHLPWRMMTYKALNTFIDDIFAFVIKMPTLYRIGCFRDDIVFFIFLYQRWIYRVDPKRVNEFGVSAEMLIENQPQEVEGQSQQPLEQKNQQEKKDD